MAKTYTCYIAGPDVFLPNAVEVITAKVKLCAAAGFKALIPGDNAIAGRAAAPANGNISREIYAANAATMKVCDFGICHLTPFRGISADVGTVFELGMLTGLGKPVFGYTNVTADYIDRIWLKQSQGLPPQVKWTDDHGWTIENFGNADNLMIDGALAAAGADMVRSAAPIPTLLEDLAGFQACLKLAAAHFAPPPKKSSAKAH